MKLIFGMRLMKKSFFDSCLKVIANATILPEPDLSTSYRDCCKKLRGEITQRYQQKLIVLVYEEEIGSKMLNWLPFGKNSINYKIRKRKIWLENFNQLWQDCIEPQNYSSPLLFLFCLKMPQRISARNKPCFRLQPISHIEFKTWHDATFNLLVDHGREISSQLTQFKTHFLNANPHKNGEFQLSYQRFIDHTQTATQKMSKK